jgi:hypothetical protein
MLKLRNERFFNIVDENSSLGKDMRYNIKIMLLNHLGFKHVKVNKPIIST